MKSKTLAIATLGLAMMAALSCKSRSFNSDSNANANADKSEAASKTASLAFVTASGGDGAQCLYVGRMSESWEIQGSLRLATNPTSNALLGPVRIKEILARQGESGCAGGGCPEGESLNLAGGGISILRGLLQGAIFGSSAGLLIATGALMADGGLSRSDLGVLSSISSPLLLAVSAVALIDADNPSSSPGGNKGGGTAKDSDDQKMSLDGDEPNQISADGYSIPVSKVSASCHAPLARPKPKQRLKDEFNDAESAIYAAVVKDWEALDIAPSEDEGMTCQPEITDQDFCDASSSR
jgi:hypothetical protein